MPGTFFDQNVSMRPFPCERQTHHATMISLVWDAMISMSPWPPQSPANIQRVELRCAGWINRAWTAFLSPEDSLGEHSLVQRIALPLAFAANHCVQRAGERPKRAGWALGQGAQLLMHPRCMSWGTIHPSGGYIYNFAMASALPVAFAAPHQRGVDCSKVSSECSPSHAQVFN